MQTFDIRYDNELAHDYYRDGADLAAVYVPVYLFSSLLFSLPFPSLPFPHAVTEI